MSTACSTCRVRKARFRLRVGSGHGQQSVMNPRLKNHLGNFLFCAPVLAGALVVGPPAGAADRLSIVTAYLCFGLLSFVLLIGPANVIRTGRILGNHYARRDAGIWAAIMGLAHFVLANMLSMNYAYLDRFVNFPELSPTAAIRDQLYSWGTILGFLVAVLFIMLLGLSSDWALRKIGMTWWKRLQRASYAAFLFTSIHAVAFQVIESRSLVWVGVILVVSIIIAGMQLTGVLSILRAGTDAGEH
jgi:DMSO/TMAO reductase YedYZ heme-binding membrane subunit